MSRYLLVRACQGAVLLLIVSAVIFLIVHSAPGGPAILNNPDVDPHTAQAIARDLGLTDPVPVQYARWLGRAIRGNLGRSYQHQIPVVQLIANRIPNTLILTGTALALGVLAAIPLGVISAVRRYSAVDYTATVGAFIGVSIPTFWLGIMFIVLFSVTLGWLPSAGMRTAGVTTGAGDLLRHLIMPAVVLSTFPLAQLMRYARSSMVEVLSQDYVRTAQAKGLSPWRVLGVHALRNALIPVVTVLGVIIPRLLSGAVITETIFAWPGLGRLAVDAAVTRDYPVIMGLTMTTAVLVIVCNLLTDVAYVSLDPRISLR
ncbi:MAG: ABC transporter permease [Armatimonadota bacterium]|nr:ABC transporter permease [Armatimonadota bacterium]MDR7520264.1 ABC transporter permease [Armatimonadota bacterium]